MVLISDPAAIKALYTRARARRCRRAATSSSSRSSARSRCCCQEGAEHLARRRLMLPPFHGERMRSYEATMDEIVDAEIDSWPLDARVPDPRADAGGDAGGDPAGRLRRRRAGRGSSACGRCSRRSCRKPPRPGAQVIGPGAAAASAAAGPSPSFEGQLQEVDELLFAEIAEHRAAARPRGARGHPLDADARPSSRTATRMERPGAARPADDAAAGRPRDDRDGAGLDLRPAAAPPGGAGAAARLARGGRGGLPAGDDLRVAAPAPGDPAGRAPPRQGARRRRPDPAGRAPTSPRRSGSPTPAPTSIPSPSPSSPSASSRTAPTPTPGSPSAAASAAASAPPSPSSRCGSSCARC